VATCAPSVSTDPRKKWWQALWRNCFDGQIRLRPDRIDTIIDFPALERFGVKFVGNQDGGDAGAGSFFGPSSGITRIVSCVL
jgi:hypothetical protein